MSSGSLGYVYTLTTVGAGDNLVIPVVGVSTPAILKSSAYLNIVTDNTLTANSCVLPSGVQNGTLIKLKNDSALFMPLYIFGPYSATAGNNGSLNGIASANGAGFLLPYGSEASFLLKSQASWIVSESNNFTANGLGLNRVSLQADANFAINYGNNNVIYRLIAAGAQRTITLPAAASNYAIGFKVKFIMTAVAVNIIRIDGGAGLMNAKVFNENGANIAGLYISNGAAQYIQFTATAQIGDYIEIEGNGTNWVGTGFSGDPAGMSIA